MHVRAGVRSSPCHTTAMLQWTRNCCAAVSAVASPRRATKIKTKKRTTRKEVNVEDAETVTVFLVCVFTHTAEDAMNERRSGALEALLHTFGSYITPNPHRDRTTRCVCARVCVILLCMCSCAPLHVPGSAGLQHSLLTLTFFPHKWPCFSHSLPTFQLFLSMTKSLLPAIFSNPPAIHHSSVFASVSP